MASTKRGSAHDAIGAKMHRFCRKRCVEVSMRRDTTCGIAWNKLDRSIRRNASSILLDASCE